MTQHRSQTCQALKLREFPEGKQTRSLFWPWLKVQDVDNWKSDVIKSVTLAANDGDKAAWQEWILPATELPDSSLLTPNSP
jgi:hypothetical protein